MPDYPVQQWTFLPTAVRQLLEDSWPTLDSKQQKAITTMAISELEKNQAAAEQLLIAAQKLERQLKKQVRLANEQQDSAAVVLPNFTTDA